MAAYFRWLMRSVGPLPFRDRTPTCAWSYWVQAWSDFLCWETADLLESPGVLLALCKTVLYRHFDVSDKVAAELDMLLIKRYGMDCVAKTWRTQPDICKAMGVAA